MYKFGLSERIEIIVLMLTVVWMCDILYSTKVAAEGRPKVVTHISGRERVKKAKR